MKNGVVQKYDIDLVRVWKYDMKKIWNYIIVWLLLFIKWYVYLMHGCKMCYTPEQGSSWRWDLQVTGAFSDATWSDLTEDAEPGDCPSSSLLMKNVFKDTTWDQS